MNQETLQHVNPKNNLTISEEFEILKFLFEKYNLKTISDYSKDNNISRQSVYNQIEKGQIMSIELSGINFICN